MQLVSFWEQAQDLIKEKIGTTSYNFWFSTLQVHEKDQQTLVIETPDIFFKNWIVDNYQGTIQDTIENLSKQNIEVEFLINPQLLKEDTQKKIQQIKEGFKTEDRSKSALNNRFTFDNFVIGSANRFACAAGLAVAESPAKAYNPLFIYGKVGLGKTHLIQAITHKIRGLHPQLKHCYLSSEKFTNELISAIQHRSTPDFRKRYREIDVLLIDDIQFIAGKESTQEEFFHTFNYLHNSHKQIIITSDRPPKDISNLEERLSSRFAWGLIADIQPPNLETRVAILKKKIEVEPVDVPDDVIFFIAEQIKSNIRELEGALIRVAAYSLLEDKTITLDMANNILKDMVKEKAKIIDINTIQKTVAQYFGVPLSELRAKKRNKNIVTARQVAMYLARQLANMSFPEIGNAFGGKDHTTVLHSCKKVEKQIQDDPSMQEIIEKISTTLQR